MGRVKIKELLFTAVVILIFMVANAFLGLIDSSNTANAAAPDYVKVSQAESPPSKSPEFKEEIYRHQYYPASEVYFDPERWQDLGRRISDSHGLSLWRSERTVRSAQVEGIR